MKNQICCVTDTYDTGFGKHGTRKIKISGSSILDTSEVEDVFIWTDKIEYFGCKN